MVLVPPADGLLLPEAKHCHGRRHRPQRPWDAALAGQETLGALTASDGKLSADADSRVWRPQGRAVEGEGSNVVTETV